MFCDYEVHVFIKVVWCACCRPGKRSPVPAAAAMASSPSNSTSSSSISDALASELGVTSPTRAAVVSTSNGNINADTSAHSSPVPTSSNPKTDSNKNSKRLLTGLSFGKKQSSVSQSSPISPAPELTIQQKNALQYGLLFVQDPSLFIVVSQDKTDLKTGNVFTFKFFMKITKF